MKFLAVLPLVVTLSTAQIGFNNKNQQNTESTTKPADGDINLRLGLLATSLGVSPVGSANSGGASSGQSSSSLTDNSGQAGGRISQQCCCVSASEQCGDPLGREDLVGSGFIDPRFKNGSISTRIINIPQKQEQINSCPRNLPKTCCYDGDIDLSVFGKTCISPEQASNNAQGVWRQFCGERVFGGGEQCGTRRYTTARGLPYGTTSPGEFPWTCLLLNQNNDFIGSCALIPDSFSNNNAIGTRKVITAAHKLKKIGKTDELKVRVGEYDASGFNPPETYQHREYTVSRILVHPKFNSKRLDHNLAILTVDRNIDLGNPNVNTACLPSCEDQFDFRFNNGTGSRCWVAGWGKNENGEFQFIQKKVDLPLFERNQCNRVLKAKLNERRRGTGDRFSLSSSELCAGGEPGKDACTGDGGSPLVCQAQSGRWTVVGLVAWGIGCASDIPGVYTRVSYFKDWINAN